MRTTRPPANPCFVISAYVAMLFLAGCGRSSTAPTVATGGTTAATPTPAPTATTTPSSGASLPASCRTVAPGVGVAAGCRPDTPDFLRVASDAVSFAQGSVATDPDTRETFPIILNGVIQSPNAYVKAVADYLDRQGLCAVYDGEEIDVRNTSTFNEKFDIITSRGEAFIRYESTCQPATPLPVAPTLPRHDTSCGLGPSSMNFCLPHGSIYEGDVMAAVDEVIAQQRALPSSDMLDFRDVNAGTVDGYKVKDVPAYFAALLRQIRAKGYCATYTGEDEILVKKGTNRLSEHYDLLKAEGYILRSFVVACRDAAF